MFSKLQRFSKKQIDKGNIAKKYLSAYELLNTDEEKARQEAAEALRLEREFNEKYGTKK